MCTDVIRKTNTNTPKNKDTKEQKPKQQRTGDPTNLRLETPVNRRSGVKQKGRRTETAEEIDRPSQSAAGPVKRWRGTIRERGSREQDRTNSGEHSCLLKVLFRPTPLWLLVVPHVCVPQIFFCSNALIALARSLCKCLLAQLITASGANAVKGYLVPRLCAANEL